jgi:hypothetical protein
LWKKDVGWLSAEESHEDNYCKLESSNPEN